MIAQANQNQQYNAEEIYFGAEQGLTNSLLNQLNIRGPEGKLAAQLFRVLRAAEKPTLAVFGQRVAKLCEMLTQDASGLHWGWSNAFESQDRALRVQLPTGQVEIIAPQSRSGPEFPSDQIEVVSIQENQTRILAHCQIILGEQPAERRLGSYSVGSPDNATDSVRSFFRAIYQLNRLAAASPLTINQYELAINKAESILGTELTINNLTDDLVSNTMSEMIQAGCSPASANKVRRHLLALWRFAYERKLTKELCRVRPYREPKRQKQAWLPEEFAKILESAAKQPGYIGAAPAGVWWCAFLYLAVNTGARVSALMAIRTEDVSLKRRHVLIRAETQKQNADQQFDLWPETIQLIKRLDSHKRKLSSLFEDWRPDRLQPGWPGLNRRYRRILQRAGLPSGPEDLFHKLRRTTASWFVKTTHSVDRCRLLLGHSTAAVTERYLDWRQIDRDNVSEILTAPTPPNIAVNVAPEQGKGGSL